MTQAPQVPPAPMKSGPVSGQPVPPRPSKLEELLDLLHTPWVIAAIVIVIGVMALFAIRNAMQKPSPPAVPTPTPTATPTPTPIRQRSPFATTSAFLNLDTAVSSFSASVKSYTTSDPSLSPPVIDLPLGF